MITRQWETRFERQLAQQQLVRHRFLVERSIEGMIPFIAFDDASNRGRAPLFLGEPDAMTWVTVSPIWQSSLALATLRIGRLQHDGVAYWEYREAPLQEVFAWPTEVDFSRQELILWPVSEQRFNYLGYTTIEQRLYFDASLGAGMVPELVWHTTYKGLDTLQLPRAISLGEPSGEEVLLIVNVPSNDLRYLKFDD